MTIAVLSLLALVVALALSMTSRVNVGLLGLALAWGLGVYGAGLKPDAVMAGFPIPLFLTLVGVTLLFGLAEANGTLAWVAARVVRLARGNVRLVPLLFFAVACLLSTVGPGAISSVALLIPLAIAIGERVGVSHFLTALMVANGANAGNLSPISSVGVIANSAMAKAGLGGHEWRVWAANFAAHALVAAVALVAFGRFRDEGSTAAQPGAAPPADGAPAALSRAQWFTLTVVGAWIAGVVVLKLALGLSAFAAATLLLLGRAAEEGDVVRRVPWGVILMVTGVSLLIALLEQTGGMDLFTTLLARLATPGTVNGVIAFVTGAISTYSSTSGVVLPAFLPTVGALVQKVGGGDPLAVALSINVGSALVDVSPLSTLGALCVAAVHGAGAARALFQRLLAWGLAMTVVGAALCQLLAGALARA